MATCSVTVTCKRRDRFTVAFSQLGERQFGPWGLPETIRDLQVSALLSPQAARDLVLEASVKGSATVVLA